MDNTMIRKFYDGEATKTGGGQQPVRQSKIRLSPAMKEIIYKMRRGDKLYFSGTYMTYRMNFFSINRRTIDRLELLELIEIGESLKSITDAGEVVYTGYEMNLTELGKSINL